MRHFPELSPKVKGIVDKYVSTSKKNHRSFHSAMELLVSLYAQRSDADRTIVQELSRYSINLQDHFSNEEIGSLMGNFSQVAIYCYEHDGMYSFRKEVPSFERGLITDFVTPKSLVALCLKLARCRRGSNIYLPFAGSCPFALYQEERCNYDAAELDKATWAFSKILLSSQGIKANVECKDCMVSDYASTALKTSQKKYDYIFSFPPILADKEHRIQDTFLHLALNALREGGEMFCILPMSFCYSGSWFALRKTLMWDSKKSFSATIIALPHRDLFVATSVQFCLLCLKKDHKGAVRLMDAAHEYFYKRDAGAGGIAINTNSILESLNECDERFVHTCEVDKLDHHCVNMSPSRYLVHSNLPKSGNLRALADVVDFLPKQRLDGESERFPLIGMKELSFDYMQCEVMPTTDYKQTSVGTKITSDAFLVGFMGGRFKVGKTHGVTPKSPIILRNEVHAFRIKDTSVISEDFTLRALLSVDVEQQAKMLAIGVTITRLPLDDLKSIMIEVPSLSEQERLCKEDNRKSLSDKDRKLIETAEEFRRDVHMKKHAMGQTIFNLNNWWKVLQKARKEGNGVVCDTATIGKAQPISITEVYNNLQEVIAQLQLQINSFDRGYGLERKNFALAGFIDEYISRPENQSPLFTYIYDKTMFHAIEAVPEINASEMGDSPAARDNQDEGGSLTYSVNFAPEALKIIFDDIISNATSHGFDALSETNHIIKIELTAEGTDYIITISNNGKPLDDRLSVQDVFTYNRSSKNGKGHYGIGGYEIDRLMREFGGEADFISDPDAAFPVSYKLIFHQTNTI